MEVLQKTLFIVSVKDMRFLLKLLAYDLKHRNSPFPVPDTDVRF
jgi:hypothetical protein